MTLLYNNNSASLVDHEYYISKLYTDVHELADVTVSYRLKPRLFCIRRGKQKDTSRKRCRETDRSQKETTLIKHMYEQFLKELPMETKNLIMRLDCKSGIAEVRDLSKQLFESTAYDHKGLNGGNNVDIPLSCAILNEQYLVPPNSRFYCGCVKEQCSKLRGNHFSLLVADPPWWNKYIRRLKAANEKMSYPMMYNEDIAAIPVKDLLTPSSLVAMWCTNAPSNISAVKDLIFPQWGVEYVTTWYWLKVTTDLEPLCEFGSGSQKQPYERIIIGKKGELKDAPGCKLIVSVPSALQSHKPPLLDLLMPYVNEEKPRTLELFARYLLPNTTSVGFEALKWQHLSLYDAVP